MNYLVVLFVLIASIYPFNFARYSWNKGRKTAVTGIWILTITSIILPIIVIFLMQ